MCETCSNAPTEFDQDLLYAPMVLALQKNESGNGITETTLDIVVRIKQSVVSAITQTQEKCREGVIHELKQQLSHDVVCLRKLFGSLSPMYMM